MNDDYRKKVYNMDNWQQMHVQQLSYWRNLVIILASAALGYTLSIINGELSSVDEVLLKIISLLFLLSIAVGFIIAYKESENYRLKYYISRKILQSDDFLNSDLFKEAEDKCTKIERTNKLLLGCEIIAFGIGVVAETIILISI